MRLSFNSTSPPRNIVWLQTSFLGDLIISTAAFRLAKEKFPGAKHFLISNPIGAEVLREEQIFDKIVAVDKRRQSIPKVVRYIRGELGPLSRKDTVLLQIHRSPRSSLIAACLRLPVVTYRQAALSWLATATVERVATLHESARLGLVLEPLGVDRQDIVTAKPKLVSRQSPLDESSLSIGIAPGSVWGTKRWPKEYFADLIARLIDRYQGSSIYLLGSAKEREDADYIAERLNNPSVKNIAGETTLEQFKDRIAGLDLLVANDSSPIHFASGYDVPTVAVFGATVSSMGFGPLASKREVAEIELDCRPCSDHGPASCPLGHFRCMKDLSVDQVFGLCEKVLRED